MLHICNIALSSNGSNGTYTIRVGSYGNEIRELIFSGFEVAESCVCLFVCLFDGS
jgi:hypothetical protein